MAKQWVDITTIDNNTPFSAVRWLGDFPIGDCWFSEMPGLATDNMSWTDGTNQYGYFGSHRFNSNCYTCTFDDTYRSMDGAQCELISYGVSLVDAVRSDTGYYDTAVTIDDQTYYEIDFSTWQNYTPLYFPYTGSPINAGQVYVYAANADISLSTTAVTFDYQGGSSAITVTAENDWSCSTPSSPWLSIDVTSGTSGTTVVTVTADSGYTASTSARTESITFSCNTDTVEFVASQTPPQLEPDKNSLKFKVTGGTSVVGITADLDWSASTSEQWLSISPASGTSATTEFTVSADTFTGGSADRTGTITVTDGLNTKTISVVQKYKEGADGLYLGLDDCEALYLGDNEVEALYMGDQQIF